MTNPNVTRELLQQFIKAYGPIGQETEIKGLTQTEILPLCEKTWIDEAGNLIGYLPGHDHDPKKAVRVLAHLDEISLIINKIEEDGHISVTPLGGTNGYSFGQGPVDILGGTETISGVLSIGSMHTNDKDSLVWKIKPEGGNQALDISKMYVVTGYNKRELAEKGVFVGTRVALAKSRRELTMLGKGLVGGYFMDDRAVIVSALLALREIREKELRLPVDTYWVCSVAEELGGVGAAYAQANLPGGLSLALEVAPAEKNFGLEFNDQPVVVYHDTWSTYDKTTSDELVRAGERLSLKPQRAVYSDFGSDASVAKRYGHTAKSAVIATPTINTHGYETLHLAGIENLAKTVVEFLRENNF
jgi:putative aminopeptidase FrvX